jgi:hypothetical protein
MEKRKERKKGRRKDRREKYVDEIWNMKHEE